MERLKVELLKSLLSDDLRLSKMLAIWMMHWPFLNDLPMVFETIASTFMNECFQLKMENGKIIFLESRDRSFYVRIALLKSSEIGMLRNMVERSSIIDEPTTIVRYDFGSVGDRPDFKGMRKESCCTVVMSLILYIVRNCDPEEATAVLFLLVSSCVKPLLKDRGFYYMRKFVIMYNSTMMESILSRGNFFGKNVRGKRSG